MPPDVWAASLLLTDGGCTVVDVIRRLHSLTPSGRVLGVMAMLRQ